MRTYHQVERELDTASKRKYHRMVARDIRLRMLLREGMEHKVNKGSAETLVDLLEDGVPTEKPAPYGAHPVVQRLCIPHTRRKG